MANSDTIKRGSCVTEGLGRGLHSHTCKADRQDPGPWTAHSSTKIRTLNPAAALLLLLNLHQVSCFKEREATAESRPFG